jgi:hypothetical protein
MQTEERLYLLMLADVLIELRSMESGKWELVRKLSDLFHNVLFSLQSGRLKADPAEAWSLFEARAEELGFGKEWARKLRASAEQSIYDP